MVAIILKTHLFFASMYQSIIPLALVRPCDGNQDALVTIVWRSQVSFQIPGIEFMNRCNCRVSFNCQVASIVFGFMFSAKHIIFGWRILSRGVVRGSVREAQAYLGVACGECSSIAFQCLCVIQNDFALFFIVRVLLAKASTKPMQTKTKQRNKLKQ